MRTSLLAQLAAPAREAAARLLKVRGDVDMYAVGGAVRDLLLGRPLHDLDLAVEGDAVAIARSAFGERVRTHARFGTASMRVGRTRVDIATTRREQYDRPGALPRTQPAPIEDDLRRRDFSVNAMAIALSGPGRFLDPCGGVDDLNRRLIRALHGRSFIDDPTRIYRAFRYAARLGFRIEPSTGAWIDGGLTHVPAVSGERLRRELELLFQESAAGEALSACGAAGALHAIHGALQWPERGAAALARTRGRAERLATGFALLAAGASAEDASAVVERLRLRREEAAAVRAMAALRTSTPLLRKAGLKPSGVVMLLERYPRPSVNAFAATSPDTIAASLCLRYLAEWSHVRPHLKGDDVIALGIPEGPQVRQALQLIRAARLDGIAAEAGDERLLARRFAASIREAGAMPQPVELADDER